MKIPSEIGNLLALESLYLGSNDLTGEIPPEIGNLSELRVITLSNNDLTGVIPETFSNLLNLSSFYADGNAGLCLPASLASWHAGIFNTDSIFECSSDPTTAPNAVPLFTSPATFNAPENQTSVGTVAASDSDAGDSVTGYAIHSGADSSMFSIVASTGVVTFVSPPNFEAPVDADTDGDYVAVVRATSGEGARVKTAGPNDHGDGDGPRRGAERTGRAFCVVGLGDECDGVLDRACECRAADRGLRLPLPGDVAGPVDGGDEHDDHGAQCDDCGTRGGHGVRGAGGGRRTTKVRAAGPLRGRVRRRGRPRRARLRMLRRTCKLRQAMRKRH